MVGKYKVATLCSSTRFMDEFMETQKHLTLERNIVITIDCLGTLGMIRSGRTEQRKR